MLMKKIFSFLVIANILIAAIIFFKSGQQEQVSNAPAINPEKIIVLPPLVNCVEWGELSEQDLQSAETAINALNLQMPHKKISSATLIKYQVHTSPFKNQQAVEREINKLRNMGIISHRIEEQGALLNAISFGEFEDETEAYDLLKKLNSDGIVDATINKHKIERKKFLFFEADINKISELRALIRQFPDSRLAQTTCERL